MDLPFFLVLAFALGFASLLMVARLRSAGVPGPQVGWLVVELWAVFALWVGVLWAVAARLSPAEGVGSVGDLRLLAQRFAHFGAGEKILTIASLVLGVAVFVHLQWALRAAMAARPDGPQ